MWKQSQGWIVREEKYWFKIVVSYISYHLVIDNYFLYLTFINFYTRNKDKQTIENILHVSVQQNFVFDFH